MISLISLILFKWKFKQKQIGKGFKLSELSLQLLLVLFLIITSVIVGAVSNCVGCNMERGVGHGGGGGYRNQYRGYRNQYRGESKVVSR